MAGGSSSREVKIRVGFEVGRQLSDVLRQAEADATRARRAVEGVASAARPAAPPVPPPPRAVPVPPPATRPARRDDLTAGEAAAQMRLWQREMARATDPARVEQLRRRLEGLLPVWNALAERVERSGTGVPPGGNALPVAVAAGVAALAGRRPLVPPAPGQAPAPPLFPFLRPQEPRQPRQQPPAPLPPRLSPLDRLAYLRGRLRDGNDSPAVRAEAHRIARSLDTPEARRLTDLRGRGEHVTRVLGPAPPTQLPPQRPATPPTAAPTPPPTTQAPPAAGQAPPAGQGGGGGTGRAWPWGVVPVRVVAPLPLPVEGLAGPARGGAGPAGKGEAYGPPAPPPWAYAREEARTRAAREDVNAKLQVVGGPEHMGLVRQQLALQREQTTLARREQLANLQGRFGLFGGTAAAIGQSFKPVTDAMQKAFSGLTGTLGALGVGVGVSGLAAAAGPMVSETFFNSMQLFAANLAYHALPSLVQFSAEMQAAARWVGSWGARGSSFFNGFVKWTAIIGVGYVAFSSLMGTVVNTGIVVGTLGRFAAGAAASLATLARTAVAPAAASMMPTVMSRATMGLGAFALAVGAATAAASAYSAYLRHLTGADASQEAAGQAADIAARGQATAFQYGQLPGFIRQELDAAATDEERLRIATMWRDAQQRQLEIQRNSAQRQVAEQESIWSSWSGGGFTPSSHRRRREGDSVWGDFVNWGANSTLFSGLSNMLIPPGLVNYTTGMSGTIRDSANLVPNQLQQQIATLQAVINRGGTRPTPEGQPLSEIARNFQMAFSAGGFQSQQMALENIHSSVTQSAIMDPLQEELRVMQLRSMQRFMELADEIMATQPGTTFGQIVRQLGQVTGMLGIN